MIILSDDLFGCADVQGYSVSRSGGTTRIPALKGRARYRLNNQQPSFLVRVQYEWSLEQFAAFQTFWIAGPAQGEPFGVRLKLTTLSQYEQTEWVPAQATGAYSATLNAADRWTVTLDLEVPSDVNILGEICDVIWGGAPGMLPPDDIWNGPIDNLPTDIIEPCAGVLPDDAT